MGGWIGGCIDGWMGGWVDRPVYQDPCIREVCHLLKSNQNFLSDIYGSQHLYEVLSSVS